MRDPEIDRAVLDLGDMAFRYTGPGAECALAQRPGFAGVSHRTLVIPPVPGAGDLSEAGIAVGVHPADEIRQMRLRMSYEAASVWGGWTRMGFPLF